MRRPKDYPDGYDPNYPSIYDVLRFLGRDPKLCLPNPKMLIDVIPVTEQEYHAYVKTVVSQYPREYWRHPHDNYELWVECAKEDWNETANEYREHDQEESRRLDQERAEAREEAKIQQRAELDRKAREESRNFQFTTIMSIYVLTIYSFWGQSLAVHISNIVVISILIGIAKLIWAGIKKTW